MEKIKFAQVAKTLGVSLNSVYRKVKLSETQLNGHVIKENGVTFITTEGIEILRGLFARLNPGETPENREDPAVAHLKEIVGNQQRTIDNLIARQAEERQRSDSIIMKLAHDLEETRRSALAIEMKVNTLLEKPADPVPEILAKPATPVRPWTPTKEKAPGDGMGFLRRFWVEIMHPEQLRRAAEN